MPIVSFVFNWDLLKFVDLLLSVLKPYFFVGDLLGCCCLNVFLAFVLIGETEERPPNSINCYFYYSKYKY